MSTVAKPKVLYILPTFMLSTSDSGMPISRCIRVQRIADPLQPILRVPFATSRVRAGLSYRLYTIIDEAAKQRHGRCSVITQLFDAVMRWRDAVLRRRFFDEQEEAGLNEVWIHGLRNGANVL
jgi:hypothetical protein